MSFESPQTADEWLEFLVQVARAYKKRYRRLLPLTDELGELYACKKLGLHRARTGKKGFDATDAEGMHVQIKARAPHPGRDAVSCGQRVGRFHNWCFDYALLVLLNGDCGVHEIWKADVEALKAAQEPDKRAGMTVGTFRRAGRRAYPLDEEAPR